EQLTRNEQVVRSNRISSSSKGSEAVLRLRGFSFLFRLGQRMAQLAYHLAAPQKGQLRAVGLDPHQDGRRSVTDRRGRGGGAREPEQQPEQPQRQGQVKQAGGQQRAERNFRRAYGAHLQQDGRPLQADGRAAEPAGPASGPGSQVAARAHFQQHGGGQAQPGRRRAQTAGQQPEIQDEPAQFAVGQGGVRDDSVQPKGRLRGQSAFQTV